MTVEPVDEEADLLAAELALGVLEGDDLTAAERRLTDDPGFAAAHEAWVRRLSNMAGPVAPPDSIWTAILARLPGNDNSPALRRWRAAALFAFAAALLLAILPPLWTSAPPHVSPPPAAAATLMVAVLTGPSGRAALAVTIDPASGRMTTVPARLSVDGRATELWLIQGRDPPRSLGVVAHDLPGHGVASPALRRRMEVGDVLAVSLEPAGGSPTGLPTGPVILTGKIAKV